MEFGFSTLKLLKPQTMPIVLGLILLFPHGLGVRLPISHIDAPRFSIIAIIFVGAILYFRRWIISRKIDFPPGSIPMVVVMALIFFSAILSNNIFVSMLLTTQMLALWFVFPLAFIAVYPDDFCGESLNKSLMVIFSTLLIMSLIEVITQSYIVRPEWRTNYYGVEGYEWFSNRQLFRGGVLLPQGPFTWNHTLSGISCVGIAIALWAIERFKAYGLMFAYALFALIIIAGVRAGMVGCLVSVALYAIWFRQPFILLHLIAATVGTELLYLLSFGKHLPILFGEDISAAWTAGISSNQVTQDTFENSYVNFLPEKVLDFIYELGTVGVKIAGFLANLANIDDWWALGYGFGSFQRPSEVTSTAIQYNDPGIIQLIFLESGIFAGVIFILILIRAVLIGLKYQTTKYYSVGITAWTIFAVSSWDVWPVSFVMLFVLIIHRYHQLHRDYQPLP